MDNQILLFFGRFHSLVVHLPIGIILFVILLEILGRNKKGSFDSAIRMGLLSGALFSWLACALGLMLSTEGGYNPETLNLHKWAGISTGVLVSGAWLIRVKYPAWTKLYNSFLFLLVLSLGYGAHCGGSLVHGSNYLTQFAPGPVKKLLGQKPGRQRITTLDSAYVYADAIHFIFESKCTACHNPDKKKGELILGTEEGIRDGGEKGAVIKPGHPEESELTRRIRLDPAHEDFMPSDGRTPLTKEESELLSWWIEEGASFDKRISEFQPGERILFCLEQIGIGVDKDYIETLSLAPVQASLLQQLEKRGFVVQTLGQSSTMLELKFLQNGDNTFGEKDAGLLQAVGENLGWLNLSGCILSEEYLQALSFCTNLTKLDLNGARIKNTDLRYLETLKNLEYLNLYNTEIGDESLESLIKLKNLNSLFIWQTNISEEGRSRLRELLPQTDLVTGLLE